MRHVARAPLGLMQPRHLSRAAARSALPAALVAALSLGACHPAPPVPPRVGLPQLVFDLDTGPDGGFFRTPFPSDARRLPSGAPDFSGLPNPNDIAFVRAAIEGSRERDGFDPSAAIYFLFDSALPVPADRSLDTQRAFRGIELVDIDPDSPERGRRFAARVRATDHHDGIRPAHLLQLLPEPGIGLREATTYAALVLRDLDADGRPDLAAQPTLTALLGDTPAGGERAPAPAWRAALAPLRAALPTLGMEARDLAAFTVFTTGTPSRELFVWADAAMRGPAPELAGPLVRERAYDDFVVLRGTARIPLFQQGEPPHFFSGGRMVLDEGGRPMPQGFAEAPFYLTIPRGESPASGIPLYFYIHGTGGRATQPIDRGYRRSRRDVAPLGSGLASWVAPLGYATSCMAGAYSPDRIGWRALNGYAAYMFLNPVAMRDNLRQMALEQVLFLRLLEDLEIDPSLVPEVRSLAPEGKLRFARDRRIVGGQSLGSFLTGIVAGLTGAFDGAIFTGAGGSWIEFGFGPKDPIDLTAWLDKLAMERGEKLDPHHPFITVFENAVGPADNMHYNPYIQRRPRAGAKVPHVLVIQGQRDLQVPVNLQRALALALGTDLVGPETGATTAEQVLPVLRLGGLRHVPGGLGGNRRAPDGTPRTVVTVRHPEDGILEGHYVIFQQARAREQLTHFVQDVARGNVPFVR